MEQRPCSFFPGFLVFCASLLSVAAFHLQSYYTSLLTSIEVLNLRMAKRVQSTRACRQRQQQPQWPSCTVSLLH